MTHKFKTAELEAYLDEALPPLAMSQIEAALRDDPALADQLAGINARRGAGIHSLGEIWRRARLGCLSREQLGSYLLGAISREAVWYIRYHLETFGCRLCNANLEDLKSQHGSAPADTQSRRRKYFQSSAGYLKK